MLDHQSHQERALDKSLEQSTNKSKVTLYLSPDTHRQLKIRSAVDGTPMYTLAEKAITFYLENSDIVERQGYGHTHQLHTCPQCAEKLVFRNGELVAIASSPDGDTTRESSRELLLTGSAT